VLPILLGVLFSAVGRGGIQAAPTLYANNQDVDVSNTTCHPVPQSMDQVYIVGYGSLLNTTSKSKTYPDTGTNIPVRIRGYTRKWNCRGEMIGHSTTYLGVVPNPQDVKNDEAPYFNGVVFKLHSIESLKEFDRRERYYCRKEVDVDKIEFLVGKDFNNEINRDYPGEGAQFWAYIVKPEFDKPPSEKFPIVQSYVDVFLGGCFDLEISYNLTGYADDCMNTTKGWDGPWVNDRLHPRRPFVDTPRSSEIDALTLRHLPRHFSFSKLEQDLRYNYNGVPSSIGISAWLGICVALLSLLV